MHLKELEEILRPNFVWDETPGKKWNVQDNTRHYSAVGLIVYVGTAWLCGFKDSQVCDYLEIKKDKHFVYLSRFKNALRMHHAAELHELYALEDNSLERKIVKKYKMVENALRLKNNIAFVSLSEIEY